MLHEKDGTVKARCEGCAKLYQPGPRELRAIEARGEHAAAICAPCIAAAYRYNLWLDKREKARGYA